MPIRRIVDIAAGILLLPLFAVLVALIVLASLGGCNRHTDALKQEGVNVAVIAQGLHEDADAIKAAAEQVVPAIEANNDKALSVALGEIANGADSVNARAAKLDRSGANISRHAANVKDKINPFWAAAAWVTGNIAAIGVGAVLLLVFFPIVGPILVKALAWLACRIPPLLAVIPKSIRTAAQFNAEALAKNPDDQSTREGVAARRAKEPLFDVAFQAAKKKAEAKAAGKVVS